ncbi:glutamine amidotransferase-related protein [Sodalis sp. RH21]|uniref:glutamine amidotransferase-related protein n=1 Tax=unclassified Sodalis (in: enterobacteria) TaxID=2636512 RepID=UPI0039B61FB5
MTLIFVAHDTPEPALYGAMAAILADRLRLPLTHLAQAWDLAAYPDACQHAAAAGPLVASGLIWHERLGGRGVGAAKNWSELAELPAGQDWVIPLGPAHLAELPDRLRALDELGLDYRLAQVEMAPSGLAFTCGGVTQTAWGQWRRDAYGRWYGQDIADPVPGPSADGARRDDLAAEPARGVEAGLARANGVPLGKAALCIALLGSRRDQLEVYPAIAAALGDAADALSLSLDILFASPRESLAGILDRADGVLLPGGASMANVAGQIAAARYSLDNAIPTLGLCLGMQTMTTAVAQRMLGSSEVNLAEAEPLAPVKSFVPLAPKRGHPRHRLGEQMMLSVPGSRMNALLGDRSAMRYNHRFQLNPALKQGLEHYGLRISATDDSGTIADGVEFTDHVFYLGVQGHPELSSAPGRPHPLLLAFLTAAARRREA